MTDSIDTYKNSQQFVIGKLLHLADVKVNSNNEEKEESYLLAMARKGPRSLEKMWKIKLLDGRSLAEASTQFPMLQNVITEIALPFLFHKLNAQHKDIQFCVYDDAIYYGTTFLGVYEELNYYQAIYKNVQVRKTFLAGVKSHEAKRELEERIKDDIYYYGMKGTLTEGDNIPNGFSHFFVKQLTSDIRSLHTAFEVEFPIVTFEYHEPVNEELLLTTLKSEFGEESVSRIRHEEGTNYSVVLNSYRDSIFTKIRFYPAGKSLKIACFSPCILPNDIFSLERLFPEGLYGTLWQDLVNQSSFPDEVNVDNFHAYRKMERQLCKTLVTLANYLISFSFLISIKDEIEKIANGVGQDSTFEGLEEKDLRYLLADKQLCGKVKKQLEDFYIKQVVCEALNYNTNYSPIEQVVFENTEFPSPNELMVFEEQNERMLNNSQNLGEALSALFFNQKTLIEKWAGERHGYDYGRLRFGYTFDAIVRQLKGHETILSATNHLSLDIHKWIDTRIDQGSVVPQYVINPDSNKWCRVFRPGENEDALLSHLARYVLFIFRTIDSVEKLGWIDRSFLEDVLCLSVLKVGSQQLSKELGIQLTVTEGLTDRKLLFQDMNSETKAMPVLDYMFKMFILSENDETVSVSPRLQDRELTQFTTLNHKMGASIEKNIQEILYDVDIYDPSHVFAYETFNKYYYILKMWKYDDSVFNEALRLGESLLKKINTEGTEDGDLSIVAESYFSLHKYIVRDDYWDSMLSQEDYRCQGQLAVMKFLFDIIIVFFYSHNFDSLQYITASFLEKMERATPLFARFQNLYSFCNDYKDEQHISDASKAEISEVLFNTFELLKDEALSKVTPV